MFLGLEPEKCFSVCALGPGPSVLISKDKNLWRRDGAELGEKCGEKDEVGGSYQVSARSAQTSSE